jgi:hypothetical protein
MQNDFSDEIEKILAMAKSYAERHHIIYSDTHERMNRMMIYETIKSLGNKILNLNKDETKEQS